MRGYDGAFAWIIDMRAEKKYDDDFSVFNFVVIPVCRRVVQMPDWESWLSTSSAGPTPNESLHSSFCDTDHTVIVVPTTVGSQPVGLSGSSSTLDHSQSSI